MTCKVGGNTEALLLELAQAELLQRRNITSVNLVDVIVVAVALSTLLDVLEAWGNKGTRVVDVVSCSCRSAQILPEVAHHELLISASLVAPARVV